MLNALPRLEILNGKVTKDDDSHYIDIEEKDFESISLDKEELEKFNKICVKINEKLKLVSKENKFNDNYQSMVKSEIEKINKCIEHSVPNYVYATEIISSKVKISNFFVEKFLEYVEKKDTEICTIFRDIFSSIYNSHTLVFEIIDKLYPKISDKTHHIKSQLENTQKENKEFESNIRNLEEKLRQANKEKEILTTKYKEENKALLDKIGKLQEENDEMSKKVLRKTKDLVNESIAHRKYIDILI
jgi:hypothetical protein